MRFLQAHAAVTRRLEAELQGECDISLAEYEALLHLARAEEGRLRMSDLADPLLLSRSGVTRLVDRLEASGEVERAPARPTRAVVRPPHGRGACAPPRRGARAPARRPQSTSST